MMKSHLLAAVAAAVVLAASIWSLSPGGSNAAAQAPAGQAARAPIAPPTVALLDINQVFKQHVLMKQQMDEMKTDVDRAEAWVKGEKETIGKMAEGLKQYRQGSPEYKKLEEDAAKRQADLSIKIQQQRRDFLQREARIYYSTYTAIQNEVNYYCASTGVSMVLRFSKEPADVDNPDSVLAFIQKPVVTYATNLDITDVIINQLNGRAAPVADRTRAGVGVR